MPREINCFNCGGEGWYYTGVCHPVTGFKENINCEECSNGKITVYTQEELNKAVKEEREACALICDSWTEIAGYVYRSVERCAKAIRARGKNE